MADVASLAFKVDTSQLEKGSVALDKIKKSATGAGGSFSSASKIFAAAVAGMNQGIYALVLSTKKATKEQIAAAKQAMDYANAVFQVASAQEKVANSATKAAKATGTLAKAFINAKPINESKYSTNSNVFDMAGNRLSRDQIVNRFNTANIAAQFQDIGVTAAMGMNPLLIALQQGTQLSAILNSMTSPLQGLKIALTQIINPLSLMSIGLTAAVAAGIQMVDWAKVANGVVTSFGNALNVVGDNISVLTAGAVSIAALTVNFTKLGAVISKAAIAFAGFVTTATVATSTWLSANPWAIAVAGVTALTIAVITLKDEFSFLNGIAQVLGKTINSVIGSLVAGFELAKGVVNSFSEVLFGRPRDSAAEFQMAWQKATDAVSVDYIGNLSAKIKELGNSFTQNNIGKSMNWDEMNRYIDETLRKLEQQTILVGKTGYEAEQLTRLYELQNKALEEGTVLTKFDNLLLENKSHYIAQAALKLQDAQDALSFSQLTEEINTQVSSLELEYTALFSGAEATEALRIEQELLADATSRVNTLTPEMESSIRSSAQAMAEMKNKTAETQKTMNFATSTTSSFFKDMKNDLADGASLWESFGNAVLNVIDSITNKMIDIGSDMLVRSLMGLFLTNDVTGLAGKPGTNTTVLSGSYTGSMQSYTGPMQTVKLAKGGAFTNGLYNSPTLFRFAKGGKFGVMGEAGPEAVMPLTRSSDGSLGVRADISGSSNGNVVVNVINNSNASARTEQKQTSQGMEIDVIIDQMVSQKIGEQNSSTSRALSAYTNRKLIAR